MGALSYVEIRANADTPDFRQGRREANKVTVRVGGHWSVVSSPYYYCVFELPEDLHESIIDSLLTSMKSVENRAVGCIRAAEPRV